MASNCLQFFAIVGNASASTTEGKGWTDNQRIGADFFCDLKDLIDRVGGTGVGNLKSDLKHDLLEEGPVFATFDGICIGSDQTDSMFFEHAVVNELHGGIQGGLTTQCREKSIRFLSYDDLFDHGGRDRLDVGPVCKLRISHDGGRIRVYQHHLISLLGKSLAGLNAGVIKFASLTDDNRTGSDQEDFMNGSVFGHGETVKSR